MSETSSFHEASQAPDRGPNRQLITQTGVSVPSHSRTFMVSLELQVMAAAGTRNMTLGLKPAHRARFPLVVPMCMMVCICIAKKSQEQETPAQIAVL